MLLPLLAAALAAVLAGCGGGSALSRAPATPAGQLARPTHATLVLDFIPNAVHAGIYRALAAGYYRHGRISLKVVQPTSTADTLKLIDAGKADFGIADGIDVANQIDKGRDAQAILAVVQRPLGAPIARADEHLRSPRDLVGRTVGITGVPSDLAVLDTVVRHAGGDPRRIRTVTVGFDGVQALESHKLAAFTGYWADDGVQAQVDGFPVQSFKLDDNGGPAYPGLVVFSTRRRIREAPALMRAFVAATVHGYLDTLLDPARSLDDLLRQNPTLQRRKAQASLDAYLPIFRGDAPAFGMLRADRLRALSNWLLANGLTHAAISPARFATDEFLPGR